MTKEELDRYATIVADALMLDKRIEDAQLIEDVSGDYPEIGIVINGDELALVVEPL